LINYEYEPSISPVSLFIGYLICGVWFVGFGTNKDWFREENEWC